MLSAGEREEVSAFCWVGFRGEANWLWGCCSQLEGSVIQISDQGLRKVLYQKVRMRLAGWVRGI